MSRAAAHRTRSALARRHRRPFLSAVALFAVLAAIVLGYSSTGGGSRDHLMTAMLINMVLVLGMQIFIGNSGVVSFGHAAFAAVGAYAAALLSTPTLVKGATIPHAPFGLAEVHLGVVPSMIVGVLGATALAALLGLAITRLSGLGASIVTLAMLIVTYAILTNWTGLTGGAEAFYGIPVVTTKGWMLAAVFVVIMIARLFRGSALGLRVQATREDELAAASSGVQVIRSRYLVWVLSAGVTAAGGVLFAHFLGAINPDGFYLELSFLTLAMLVLGGMSSVTGAVLGTVIVTAGSELARHVGDGPVVLGQKLPEIFGLSQLFLGAVILAMMALRPAGAVGDLEIEDLVAGFRGWVRRRRERGEPALDREAFGLAEWSAVAREPADACRGHLRVSEVSRFFQGLAAVKRVSLEVRPGEIVGLIGPNGAGKTTLLNMISGVLPPSEGAVELDAEPIGHLRAVDIARRGVARTFQSVRLFTHLTVEQNVQVAVSVADRHRRDARRLPLGHLLAQFGLDDVAGRVAGTLAYGRQRGVEMARAAALAPDLLLLDEPAAGMNEVESRELLEAVRGIRDRQGCSILVIDHDLHFVMNLCERIYVLDAGEVIAAGTPDEVQRDPRVTEAYLGSRAAGSAAGLDSGGAPPAATVAEVAPPAGPSGGSLARGAAGGH